MIGLKTNEMNIGSESKTKKMLGVSNSSNVLYEQTFELVVTNACFHNAFKFDGWLFLGLGLENPIFSENGRGYR